VAVNLTGIDLGGTPASSTHKTASPPPHASTNTTQDATQQPQTEVRITSTASLLSHLQRSLATGPAIDQSRVDSISSALANGTYKLNSHQIASGLIDSERALSKLK
jgi:negative regulator of flagellin synthesis FlgM